MLGCSNKRVGLFLGNLRAKKIEVNCIKYGGGGLADNFVSVNFTFGVGTLGSEGFFFVADRKYQVISVKEIHMAGPTVGTISVINRNGSGDSLITSDIDVSGAVDTGQTVTITNPVLVKEDLVLVRLNPSTGFLSGCLLSIILKVL